MIKPLMILYRACQVSFIGYSLFLPIYLDNKYELGRHLIYFVLLPIFLYLVYIEIKANHEKEKEEIREFFRKESDKT